MLLRKITQTEEAPMPIGPYVQAVCIGDFVFISGQIPLDPRTMQVVGKDDIKIQTRQVLNNLGAILKASNCNFSDVVKTTIFLKDMNTFEAMNEIYTEFFHTNLPARSTVEVARLPKDALVEIELVACCASKNGVKS